MFAVEVWTLRAMELNHMEVWKRKILRRIFGGVNVDGTAGIIWRAKYHRQNKGKELRIDNKLETYQVFTLHGYFFDLMLKTKPRFTLFSGS